VVEYFRGKGGRAIYGVPIGIISNKTLFARVPGDAGNVSTFPFPTVIEAVDQPIPRIVSRDPTLFKLYVDVIRRFEEYGVKAITTVCGFNIVFQDELAKAAKVPVFASSLLQLPIVKRILPPGKKIGILTANGKTFNEHKDDLLTSAGLDHSASASVFVEGMETREAWSQGFSTFFDEERVEKAVVEAAQSVVSRNPDIGAIVFECHNLPPYAKAVQDTTGLPVFNIMTLVDMMYGAVVSRRYTGIM
jgi:hypothetical protein